MPTAPTLAIADNADGTGATATVSGSDAGSTNEVFVGTWGDDTGSVGNFVSGGSRSGDGTVSLSLSNGYHWAYIASTLAGDTVPSLRVYFNTTNGDDSIHKQCIDAVVARCQSLNLADILTASIVARKVPSDIQIGSDFTVKYPAIVVSNGASETLNPAAGSVSKDDVGYPVDIGVLQAERQKLTENHDKYLRWREQIRRAIHNQRLPGVPVGVFTTFVEPGTITGFQQWRNGYYASFLTVRFFSRETRGLT
ncbi:MAG: hypothetical protein MI757_00055 [Pirellulales bacterium]|nr:hypothetical protein [Pirellulales bacterium]